MRYDMTQRYRFTSTQRARRDRGRWTDLENPDHVPERYEDDILGALERVRSSTSAVMPLRYIGIGMTGVVFCDARGRGFKAARCTDVTSRRFLDEEAAWLEVASTVPGVREHVARFVRYYPRHGILERECVHGSSVAYRRKDNRWEIHQRIRQAMAPYGFGAPEFKEDSYIHSRGRGWILVDASMPILMGARLVAHAVRVLRGLRVADERPVDVAYALRMEAGRTVNPERAARLSDRLLALPDAEAFPK